jgi:hypothetical protein
LVSVNRINSSKINPLLKYFNRLYILKYYRQMTTTTRFLNSNLRTASLTNNDALNRILAIFTNNTVQYINNTAVNPFNQALNTTNNATFNAMTVTRLTGPSNVLTMSGVTKYQNTITTTTATTTTILTIATTNNTNYYITVEASAFCRSGSLIGTGGSFRQTKRITNPGGGSLIISSNLENLASTSITGATINITASGTNILVNVTGVASNTIAWLTYTRIIAAS